jgi:acetoin utilization deacetylase AcuC-like enzyme
MTTLYLSHCAALDHRTPHGHPERPDRIRAIERALEHESFAALVREQAPLGDLDRVALAHPEEYVAAIREAAPREGLVPIDADTVMSPGTIEAVLRGVGGAVYAVDEVMKGDVANAFVGMRPPGHHAERVRAMGFCFFNNAAVAARHAQEKYGAERVAIRIGTSTTATARRTSSGTTPPSSTPRPTRCRSIPVPARFPNAATTTPSSTRRRRPDLLIISAGFDAHWRDPLANLMLTEADFAWATKKLMELADRHAGGRVVSLLEGGYDLEGLAKSVAAHLDALMGR